MNEQLETALAELIQKTLQGVDTAKDFLVTELPDVVQQLMAWHFAWSLLWWCVGLAMIIVGTILTYYILSEKVNECEEWLFGVIPTVMAVVGGIFLIIENFDWLKIDVAPKVWLIEYAGTILK